MPNLSALTTLSACGVLIMCVSTAGDQREWSSRDGRYKITAEFIDCDDAHVRLRTDTGKTISVKITKLSDLDREYLQQASATAQRQWKKFLADKGIRVTSSGPALADETQLNKGLRQARELLKSLRLAIRETAQVAQFKSQTHAAINAVTQQNVVVNSRLSAASALDSQLHNQLVAAANANLSRLQLLRAKLGEVQAALDASRSKSNAARTAFVQQLYSMRTMADAISARYATLASDPEVIQTLTLLGVTVPSMPVKLAPSRGFQNTLRRLRALEDNVVSEDIPLRAVGGTMFVDVVVNGKHTREMVLDSGASFVSLPSNIAQELEVTVPEDAPEIVLRLADGRDINGRLVKLSSVRIGKFSVNNVDCAVLGPDATDAAPLLGMSFLSHFKFEIDPVGKLNMVKVTAEVDERGSN